MPETLSIPEEECLPPQPPEDTERGEIREIIRDRIRHPDLRFGGNPPNFGKPSSPKSPGKKINWKEDVEIDPENPQVKVEMDIDSVAAYLKVTGSQFGQTTSARPPIKISIDKQMYTFDLLARFTQNSSFSFKIRSDQLKESTADHEYETFFKQLLSISNNELKRQNLSLNCSFDVFYIGIKLPDIHSFSSEELKSELEKMRQGLAIVLEVLLRMLSDEQKREILIPSPFIKETTDSIQAQGIEEAKQRVKGLEVSDIKLKLTDMGGNPELKEQLKRLVSQYENPQFFLDRGVRLPKGILLHGPPGTGKTLAAKIFAGEIGRKFYHVKASDILSKFYGESEQILKGIFEHVESPCIIFIDEIDSIGEHRDHASEPTRKVLTELLQQLDGLQSRKDIILLAATNRKDSLDSALLRPGRFDRHILVERPDEEARKQIWSIHLRKQIENSLIPMFETSIDIDRLAQENEGLVGADIEEIIRRTKEKAVYSSFNSDENVLISTKSLLDEIMAYKMERQKEMEQQRGTLGFHS